MFLGRVAPPRLFPQPTRMVLRRAACRPAVHLLFTCLSLHFLKEPVLPRLPAGPAPCVAGCKGRRFFETSKRLAKLFLATPSRLSVQRPSGRTGLSLLPRSFRPIRAASCLKEPRSRSPRGLPWGRPTVPDCGCKSTPFFRFRKPPGPLSPPNVQLTFAT